MSGMSDMDVMYYLLLLVFFYCLDRYSAKVLPPSDQSIVRSAEDLAVVAGTVFNTVILWNCEVDSCEKSPVLHNLSGHRVSMHAPTIDTSGFLYLSCIDSFQLAYQ